MICANLSKIEQCIAGRAVTLIAVSKTRPIGDILQAFEGGIRNFGESYLQEALPKMKALQAYPIVWHYVGRLQSNKLKEIVQHFSVIHSLDRLDHAHKLNQIAVLQGKKISVFIQVNLDAEPQKGGVPLKDLEGFVDLLQTCTHLKVEGLMLIPKPGTAGETWQKFQYCKSMSHSLQAKIAAGLSMGMSQDYALALDAGATHIRLGRAIFEIKH